MQAHNESALKEWAAVEQILARGDSTILLRKGGIWERKEGFEVEHREFWIFPTRYHQNPVELVEGFDWSLQAANDLDPGRERIRIQHYAVVDEAVRVDSLQALERLEGLHPLTPETVRSRFNYRGQPYLHLLILRVFALAEARVVANTLDYEGCVSWVQLDEPLPTAGSSPVLAADEFSTRRDDIHRRLRGEG